MVNNTKGVSVLMIGNGEYTTGFVNGKESDSDKGCGVVALCLYDIRKRLPYMINQLGMVGGNGKKWKSIIKHMYNKIELKYNISTKLNAIYPPDGIVNYNAVKPALQDFYKNKILNTKSNIKAVIIFTPDDTHFNFALGIIIYI